MEFKIIEIKFIEIEKFIGRNNFSYLMNYLKNY